MTCIEKRDHSGYLIKIEFLAWIDSSMCAESNGTSFMKKYFTSRVITIKFFMHSGRYSFFGKCASLIEIYINLYAPNNYNLHVANL